MPGTCWIFDNLRQDYIVFHTKKLWLFTEIALPKQCKIVLKIILKIMQKFLIYPQDIDVLIVCKSKRNNHESPRNLISELLSDTEEGVIVHFGPFLLLANATPVLPTSFFL